MTTFGFETEFIEGVDRLISQLTDRGYARQGDRLHSYHCDCGDCMALSTNPFRAQRDSSCGGEVISQVFRSDDWERATECMQALQEAALDVDAGISTGCGLHVHIGNTDGTELVEAQKLSMAWLGLEPLLWEHVAGGPWATRRGDQNHLLSQMMCDLMMGSRLWDRHQRYISREQELSLQPEDLQAAYISEFKLRLAGMSWDRHCDLAQAHHGGMYELRIFNATRVAWRIEMACRLSVALCDPEVAEKFATMTEEWLFGEPAALGARMQNLRNGYRRQGRQYRGTDAPLLQNLPIPFETFMSTMAEFDERLGELLSKQTNYAIARKEVGVIRSQITNTVNLDRWNHGQVVARMTAPTAS